MILSQKSKFKIMSSLVMLR